MALAFYDVLCMDVKQAAYLHGTRPRTVPAAAGTAVSSRTKLVTMCVPGKTTLCARFQCVCSKDDHANVMPIECSIATQHAATLRAACKQLPGWQWSSCMHAQWQHCAVAAALITYIWHQHNFGTISTSHSRQHHPTDPAAGACDCYCCSDASLGQHINSQLLQPA